MEENKDLFGMWSNATDLVEGLDNQFYWIHVILVALLMTVLVPMVYFAWRYSEKNHPKSEMPEHAMTHNVPLEIAWTGIPTAILMVVFYFGYDSLKNLRTMPADATHIKVVGKMWSWTYEYENGKKTDKLYVPKGENIVLDMTAPKNDVLHSFWIPAFRQKEDVVPGRTTQLWFNANQVGSYDVECTEYCGDRHSYMLSKVVVMEPADYNAWYNKAEEVSGEALASREGCLNCHSVGSDVLVGPGFAGMSEGKSNQYMMDAILNPDKDIAEGFYPGVMPTSKGVLSNEETQAIVDYLKTIK